MQNSKKEKLRLVFGTDTNTIVLGIDIAKKKHWAQATNVLGVKIDKPFRINNTRKGFEWLLGKISRIKQKTAAEKIVIGMEPSGHYWKPLARYLTDSGFKVVTVNPYHVKKSKEFDDNSPQKSDRKDAYIIAHLVTEGRFFKLYLPEGPYKDLRVLTTTRQQQKQKYNGAKNKLIAFLDEYFPEYQQVFKGIDGKASWHVLKQFPLPADIEAMSVEEVAQQLKKATRNRVGEKRAIKLKEKAGESIGIRDGLKAARIRLSSLLREFEFYQKEIEQTEIAMEKALKETGLAEYILSVKGIGVVTAASFLGEIGDISRFKSWRQIRKLSGYNLIENSSGKRKGRTKISKRGRSGLRKVLYQSAMVMVASNEEFKALYSYFKNRRKNPLKKKQALIAVAMKLIRVLFVLLKKQVKYNPEEVLGKEREKQLKKIA